ncbi:MAG: hypothetical protein UV30_C0003G0006 [Candidatus Collierbacteria bacterium GW2011_GWF1_42_50]|nr:MAG: hypothetical protein UV30_C0003G0006 [Candidatus Collierbacteria bacterium GW2011_GWF1_42_50]
MVKNFISLPVLKKRRLLWKTFPPLPKAITVLPINRFPLPLLILSPTFSPITVLELQLSEQTRSSTLKKPRLPSKPEPATTFAITGLLVILMIISSPPGLVTTTILLCLVLLLVSQEPHLSGQKFSTLSSNPLPRQPK